MADPTFSVTAAVVASTLLLLRDDPEFGQLLDPVAHESIDAAVRVTLPVFGHLLDYVPWPVLRHAALGVESVISPGFIAHYALRKHTIRTHLRQWIDEGFRQVVLLGAGFDMLSQSIPTEVSVFELDHPATQGAKRKALLTLASRTVSFVPVDFARESLRGALLRSRSFDHDARTVFVAEGLLMYLSADRAEAMLADISSSAPDVRAILTVITPDPRGRYRLHSQRKVVDWCMSWLDEPFVWGVRPEEIASLLKRHGLALESIACTTEIRDRLLSRNARHRMPQPSGELMIVGSRQTDISGFGTARHSP
jgi:methyltransferase (TIGR00027 family)